jgi:acyl dehydratase
VPTYRFADVPTLAGTKFVSTWVTVDQEKMDQFDEATYYEAEAYGWDVGSFPNNLVEGFHLLALLPPIMNLAFKIDDPDAFLLNYGLDRVRFITPVYAGDKIRVQGQVSEVKPKDEGYIVAKSCEIELEDAARPAAIVEQRSLVLPKIRREFRRT